MRFEKVLFKILKFILCSYDLISNAKNNLFSYKHCKIFKQSVSNFENEFFIGFKSNKLTFKFGMQIFLQRCSSVIHIFHSIFFANKYFERT